MIKLVEDKLGRKELLDNIFDFLNHYGNQGDKGITLILNGKYGTGKTTLFDFIDEKNQAQNNFNIIRYNAWENNTFENPLIPLLYCISKLEESEGIIKTGAKKLLKSFPKMFFSTLANAHSVDLTPLLEDDNFFDEFDEYKSSFQKFKEILKKYCKEKKTILLVDELDRCLPEYQIKVLESIYHLLAVPNLITIIALDKDQLECSIKNTFGDNQNTYGYLSKFIDYEIELSEGDTYSYVQTLMKFSCGNGDTNNVKELISNMFRKIRLPIRDCQNIINELNIYCNEKREDGSDTNWLYWYPILIAFILLVKRTNNHIYQKYFCVKRSNYNNIENIKLDNTLYMKFIKDIENTQLEKIIDMFQNENYHHLYGKSFMVHLINSFDRIDDINQDDLSTYLDMDKETINQIADPFFGRPLSNPNGINEMIKKIQIITLS